MKHPFAADFGDIQADPDPYIDCVFSYLDSEFLEMPKGAGFIEYPVFEKGYEALKKATEAFDQVTAKRVLPAVLEVPVSMCVLRAMLGLSPPEWAYLAARLTGVAISQSSVRSLDRDIRMAPLKQLTPKGVTARRIAALVESACDLLAQGAPDVPSGDIHRLDKADTTSGLSSLRTAAHMGVPYAMLLYERYLGRPFAAHRDSVSELIGDSLESIVEDILSQHRISYRKTKRAERIEGFDQAPDFLVPSEFSPQVVIEAKVTQDDGTARDKVTRIQHLGHLSTEGQPPDQPRFEVIACIAGRGFGVRREDMKKLLIATRGKVFTVRTLEHLVEYSRLQAFRAK